MKKLLLILALVTFGWGAIDTTANAEQKTVQAAINAANRGDTIIVPLDTVEYVPDSGVVGHAGVLTGLSITKGIYLIGLNTYIHFPENFARGAIQFWPDSAARANNDTFSISGFVLDADSLTMGNAGLVAVVNSGYAAISKIKIHGNTFKRCLSKAVVCNGIVYGCVYSNSFIDVGYCVTAFGYDERSWNAVSPSRGTSENLFVEDNTISWTFNGGTGGTDHGQGAPGFVFRYNTLNMENNIGGFPFVIHGLQGMATADGFDCPSGCGYSNCLPSPNGSCDGSVRACMQWSTIKSEYYGNKIINGTGLNTIMRQRGGWLMMFGNEVFTEGTPDPGIGYAQYSCNECQAEPDSSYNQRVSNTYVFRNYMNDTRTNMGKGLDYCGDYSIANSYSITENVDYWNQTDLFDGTVGIGVGTLANRPATCTPGVGYWAISDTTRDTTMAAMKTTLQGGVFYICISENTWDSAYVPYTYPHPLRNNQALLVRKTTKVKVTR